MSLWNFHSYHAQSEVDIILERQSYSLEDLLEKGDILVEEVKKRNHKALVFLSRVDVLEQLVGYALGEGVEEDEVSGKFSQSSCDILCLSPPEITDSLGENPAIVRRIWGALQEDSPPQKLTNWTRISFELLQNRTAESMEILKSTDVLTKIVAHLEFSSVCDLIVKLVKVCRGDQQHAAWLEAQGLLEQLAKKFDHQFSRDIHENVSQIFFEIINSPIPSSYLMGPFSSEPFLEELFSLITSQHCKSAITWVLHFIIEYLKKISLDLHSFQSPPESLPPVVRVCGGYLKSLLAILSEDSGPRIDTSIGSSVVLFGTHRIKILEFLNAFLSLKYSWIDAKFFEVGVFDAMIAIFFKYQWNNFIHAIVLESIISFLSEREHSHSLALLTNTKLLSYLIEASRENEDEIEVSKGYSRGYMGYLMKVANKLHQISADQLSPIATYLSNHAEWNAFADTILRKQNLENAVTTAGQSDESSQGTSSQEMLEAVPNNLANVFQEFIVRKGFLDFPKKFMEEEEDDDMEEDYIGALVNENAFDLLTFESYKAYDSDEEIS